MTVGLGYGSREKSLVEVHAESSLAGRFLRERSENRKEVGQEMGHADSVTGPQGLRLHVLSKIP